MQNITALYKHLEGCEISHWQTIKSIISDNFKDQYVFHEWWKLNHKLFQNYDEFLKRFTEVFWDFRKQIIF